MEHEIPTLYAAATLFAGLSALGAIAGLITFWMKLSSRITEAHDKAVEAATTSTTASGAVLMLKETLGLFRETVARDYVSNTALNRLEDRIGQAIDAHNKPLVEAIKALTMRFDNFRDRGRAQ
jgi:hypothetical protein